MLSLLALLLFSLTAAGISSPANLHGTTSTFLSPSRTDLQHGGATAPLRHGHRRAATVGACCASRADLMLPTRPAAPSTRASPISVAFSTASRGRAPRRRHRLHGLERYRPSSPPLLKQASGWPSLPHRPCLSGQPSPKIGPTGHAWADGEARRAVPTRPHQAVPGSGPCHAVPDRPVAHLYSREAGFLVGRTLGADQSTHIRSDPPKAQPTTRQVHEQSSADLRHRRTLRRVR